MLRVTSATGEDTIRNHQRRSKAIRKGLPFLLSMNKFENISNSDIEQAINEWIHNKRNREILHDRLIDGLIFDELSEKYNLSVQRTKSIVYKGINTVFRHIKEK